MSGRIVEFELVGGPWCGRRVRIPVEWAVRGWEFRGYYYRLGHDDRMYHNDAIQQTMEDKQ